MSLRWLIAGLAALVVVGWAWQHAGLQLIAAGLLALCG